MRCRLVKLLAPLLLLVLCAAAFWPRHGPPDFRYTGADPAFHVWNFGWPVASFLYDARSGFHAGPVAYITVPPLLVALIGNAALFWWRRRPATGVRKAADPIGSFLILILIANRDPDPDLIRQQNDAPHPRPSPLSLTTRHFSGRPPSPGGAEELSPRRQTWESSGEAVCSPSGA